MGQGAMELRPYMGGDMDAAHCKSVIEACFPLFQVQAIAFLAEGWDSRVWEVNGSHVFRFPKRSDIQAGLRKEIRLLPVLAPALPLAVPRFDYVWQRGPQYEGLFVGYRKIPGVPMAAQHLSYSGVERPAGQLGRFLTALHRFPTALAVAAGLDPDGLKAWRQYYEGLYQSVQQRVSPLLEAGCRQPMSEAWDAFLQDKSNFRFTPALIHRDLSSEHILFEAEPGEISGVIDWEDAAIGDPAFDFAGLLDYGDAFVAQVLEAYQGPAERKALKRVRFYKAIAPCYEVLFGLDAGLAEHVTAGLAGLQAIWR